MTDETTPSSPPADRSLTPPPWDPPPAGTEVEHLLGALERQRVTFRWKLEGLTATQLATTVGASTMTAAGLLKHVAAVEDCKVVTALGEIPPEPWRSVGEDAQDWAFSSAADDAPDDLYALYDAAVGRARARTARAIEEGGLDTPTVFTWPDGTRASLRRLLFDLLEEYARHTGHADLIREAVDGRVGEDPDWDGWA
ncbi:MAG: mini-circle protein [Nocardioides sp.]|nr:mini-circle protein [Nocardioides sp.]